MWNAELRNCDVDSDPVPMFASDAEIEIAERLRHQLEQRYLALAPAPMPSLKDSGETR